MPQLVAQVGSAALAGVPDALFGINIVIAAVSILIVADVVKNIEFQLWSPVADVGNSCALEVTFGLLGDIAGIAAITLASNGVEHVAGQTEGRNPEDRIDIGSFRICDQQHVAFMNQLKSANAGAIEADSLVKQVLVQVFHWQRKMLPDARQVHKLQIDNFDSCVLGRFHYLRCILGHEAASSVRDGCMR